MQKKFIPCGTVEKVHEALKLDVPGWTLGELVIGSDDVQKVLSGRPVDVSFVQERGEDVFVGFAGTARPSRSGKAINIRIEARLMTVPVAAVQAVVSGRRASAQLSSPAPVIDADAAQRKAIDHDLVRSF
jgi:hypothetical protein